MTESEKDFDEDLLPLRDGDHVTGNPDSQLTLVEFGDYECPACAEAYGIFKRVSEDLKKEIRFVFRHFPVSGSHPLAEGAAQAAEAAAAQGKFWEMHEMLFANQPALERRHLISYANRLNLDVARFTEELDDERYLAHVRSDFRSGIQNGVFSTPGVFLNGIRHNGHIDYDSLRKAIESKVAVN